MWLLPGEHIADSHFHRTRLFSLGLQSDVLAATDVHATAM
jgi:hypothetical protein